MLTIIFQFILAIVHFAYDLFEVLKTRLVNARSFTSKIYRGLRSGSFGDYDEFRTETVDLNRIVQGLNKLPVHLCIVVTAHEGKVSFHNLARLLGWSVAVGIPYVSFYDHNGFLKQSHSVLRTELEKTSPKLAEHIDWENKASSTKVGQNGHNGFRRPTRVQIFSNEDGRGEIVTLAQNLSRAVSYGLLKMEEINTELLNDKLRLENTPDPDLAFVCGPALSTYGLLPWHTRTTEFFNLRSHRDVSINDFTFLLEKYGQCLQRYGK